eukprot:752150-Hanusia_phi.AAC.2
MHVERTRAKRLGRSMILHFVLWRFVLREMRIMRNLLHTREGKTNDAAARFFHNWHTVVTSSKVPLRMQRSVVRRACVRRSRRLFDEWKAVKARRQYRDEKQSGFMMRCEFMMRSRGFLTWQSLSSARRYRCQLLLACSKARSFKLACNAFERWLDSVDMKRMCVFPLKSYSNTKASLQSFFLNWKSMQMERRRSETMYHRLTAVAESKTCQNVLHSWRTLLRDRREISHLINAEDRAGIQLILQHHLSAWRQVSSFKVLSRRLCCNRLFKTGRETTTELVDEAFARWFRETQVGLVCSHLHQPRMLRVFFGQWYHVAAALKSNAMRRTKFQLWGWQRNARALRLQRETQCLDFIQQGAFSLKSRIFRGWTHLNVFKNISAVLCKKISSTASRNVVAESFSCWKSASHRKDSVSGMLKANRYLDVEDVLNSTCSRLCKVALTGWRLQLCLRQTKKRAGVLSSRQSRSLVYLVFNRLRQRKDDKRKRKGMQERNDLFLAHLFLGCTGEFLLTLPQVQLQRSWEQHVLHSTFFAYREYVDMEMRIFFRSCLNFFPTSSKPKMPREVNQLLEGINMAFRGLSEENPGDVPLSLLTATISFDFIFLPHPIALPLPYLSLAPSLPLPLPLPPSLVYFSATGPDSHIIIIILLLLLLLLLLLPARCSLYPLHPLLLSPSHALHRKSGSAEMRERARAPQGPVPDPPLAAEQRRGGEALRAACYACRQILNAQRLYICVRTRNVKIFKRQLEQVGFTSFFVNKAMLQEGGLEKSDVLSRSSHKGTRF